MMEIEKISMVSCSQVQVYENILANYTTELELKTIEIEELQYLAKFTNQKQ